MVYKVYNRKIQEEIPTERFVVTSVLDDRLLQLRFRGSRVSAKRIFLRNFYLLRLSAAYCLLSSRVGYTREPLITVVCPVAPDFISARTAVYPVSISRVISGPLLLRTHSIYHIIQPSKTRSTHPTLMRFYSVSRIKPSNLILSMH